MAKKYKVIALSVGGLNNKIYHSGDIVLETAFINGRADELVKSGFLEVHKEYKISDVPIGKMLWDLELARVTFNSNASKEEIFDIWLRLVKK